jgi:large subunit ribosomal protein L19
MDQLIQLVEATQSRTAFPEVRPGDTVRIQLKVIEGEKERLQAFEGVVISDKGAGASKTITVRKISHGVGVERIIPVNSPNIDSVTVIKTGKARRAKLFYLRKRTGKAALKVKERKALTNAAE